MLEYNYKISIKNQKEKHTIYQNFNFTNSINGLRYIEHIYYEKKH